MKLEVPKLSTRNIALIIVFSSLYMVFSSWNLFPLVGGQGGFIKAGVVMAPLLGIILGSWLSILAITVGGIIGAFLMPLGPFGIISFFPHLASALCAGLLHEKKRGFCGIAYSFALVVFAFFPVVGPAWLWPSFLWLHICALVFYFAPLQWKVRSVLRDYSYKFALAFELGAMFFFASLFGHVVGSLMYELVYWPILIPEVSVWRANWELLTWLYPIERVIIAVTATLIGVALIKALRALGFNIND
ncbi:MAG: hypothetical protein JSV05_04915 [Candidatus Bathyarchaeota archaeon]|nr:MAG: hypothetical protein JSV05_04915 [Candidatus Bathyarchaeota archaeon]